MRGRVKFKWGGRISYKRVFQFWFNRNYVLIVFIMHAFIFIALFNLDLFLKQFIFKCIKGKGIIIGEICGRSTAVSFDLSKPIMQFRLQFHPKKGKGLQPVTQDG